MKYVRGGMTSLDYLMEIQRLENELKKYDWISVKDRLPEQYTDVIVLYDIGRAGVNWTNNENEFVNHSYCKVTHWMPLPEPPKE